MKAPERISPAASPPAYAGPWPASPQVLPAGDRLVAAFLAATDDEGLDDIAELHAATVGFVAVMKAQDLPPEKMVIALKTVLRRNGRWLSLAPECCPDHAPRTRESRAYANVFRWCLEAYYGVSRGPLADR